MVFLATKGMQYVNDNLNENGDFLSHTEISEKFGVRCHFLQALQIRQSLPLEWRGVIRSEYSYKPVREPFIYHNGAVLQLDKCTTNFIYECYVQMKYVTPHVCIEMDNVTCRFWYVWRRMGWWIFETLHLFTGDEIAIIAV